MKNFDPFYNQINKTEIHCHLEGAIRTATIIDIAREYGLPLPTDQPEALDAHVKVFDQLKDLQSVLNAFAIAQNSIASPAVVERIAGELFEDAAQQNIRLFEVRFSPDWAFSAHQLDWDAALEGLLHAKVEAEARFDLVIGIIAITSRGLGAESGEKNHRLGNPPPRCDRWDRFRRQRSGPPDPRIPPPAPLRARSRVKNHRPLRRGYSGGGSR